MLRAIISEIATRNWLSIEICYSHFTLTHTNTHTHKVYNWQGQNLLKEIYIFQSQGELKSGNKMAHKKWPINPTWDDVPFFYKFQNKYIFNVFFRSTRFVFISIELFLYVAKIWSIMRWRIECFILVYFKLHKLEFHNDSKASALVWCRMMVLI